MVLDDCTKYANADQIWQVPANAIIIPIVGTISIRGKDFKIGDVVQPTNFSKYTSKLVTVEADEDAIILSFPFS